MNEWMGNLFKLKVMFTMLLFKNLIVNAQTWFLHNVSFKLRIMEKTSNWLSFLTLCPFTLPLLVEDALQQFLVPMTHTLESITQMRIHFLILLLPSRAPKNQSKVPAISFQCNESWLIRLLQALYSCSQN